MGSLCGTLYAVLDTIVKKMQLFSVDSWDLMQVRNVSNNNKCTLVNNAFSKILQDWVCSMVVVDLQTFVVCL